MLINQYCSASIRVEGGWRTFFDKTRPNLNRRKGSTLRCQRLEVRENTPASRSSLPGPGKLGPGSCNRSASGALRWGTAGKSIERVWTKLWQKSRRQDYPRGWPRMWYSGASGSFDSGISGLRMLSGFYGTSRPPWSR